MIKIIISNKFNVRQFCKFSNQFGLFASARMIELGMIRFHQNIYHGPVKHELPPYSQNSHAHRTKHRQDRNIKQYFRILLKILFPYVFQNNNILNVLRILFV